MKFRLLALTLGLSAGLTAFESLGYIVNRTSTGAECKWPGQNVTVSYRINSIGGPSGTASAIVSAMNAWNTAGAAFQFSYGGSTTLSGDARDGLNVCSFSFEGIDGTVAVNHF